jgi:hypothetical protein
VTNGNGIDRGGYDLNAQRAPVVEGVLASWPTAEGRAAAHQRVGSEISRFLGGQGASLPFRKRDEIIWATVAPSSTDLHREIELLRAWVLPSFGWEDPRQPFVAPGESNSSLAIALLGTSPAGYFRWRCKAGDFAVVADRLARMREVAARRPEHLYERVPSLLELRQQFRTALLTGAREAAEAAIRSIDYYQLDSAVNTHLMRVRMLDEFGEYEAIVADPMIWRVLGLRLPQVVRSAIIRAFHAIKVAPQEAESAEAAATAYRDEMHPVVGGLVALARREDGPEIARSIAYRAWAIGDADQAMTLLPTADAFTSSLLRSLTESRAVGPSTISLSATFEDALRRGDLRAIQALAPSLLLGLASAQEGVDSNTAFAAIRESLEVLPNAELAAELAGIGDVPAELPATPQTWSELLMRVQAGDMVAAERFLALDVMDRPGPEQLTSGGRDAALATLEELLTSPQFGNSERWVADVALPAFVEEFVREPHFPRAELAPLYLQLLRLWSEHKRGSGYAPDAQLLLVLATAVVPHYGDAEKEVAAHLVDWWRARPVRATLPFLLEALEIILEFTAGDEIPQHLWLDGAALVARNGERLSQTERVLWRRLGKRVGLYQSVVDEVLPDEETEVSESSATDSLREARLGRVAIVSLHHRAADEAREILAQRTGANVFVVEEKVAGPATRAAQSADVILFVWAATKHAVFRAFDSIRDRVVYVQGTGAGSIVLALERWVNARLRS